LEIRYHKHNKTSLRDMLREQCAMSSKYDLQQET
jgi:hypothetical protein